MRSLLVYLKQYRKESILAPLFKMLEASFELLVPLVMAAVIDVGIAEKDSGYIIRMCLLLIALGLIGLVCSITAQYFSAKAAAGFGAGVRHALFAHIQSFSFTEMDTIGTSTLITRMTSDINQVQSGVNLVLRLFLRSPFIVFGAMVMAFTVDVKAALVFVAAIPLLSVIVFGVMLITMPLYRKVQARLDRVLLATRENLTGARVIRAFNQENEERERFYTANQLLTDAQKFAGRISGLMNPLTYVIVNGAIVVLIYVGAVRVNIGDLTQGEVVALLNYMSQIELYVSDSGGTCKAGQPDYYSDKGGGLRQPDRESAAGEAGYEGRKPAVECRGSGSSRKRSQKRSRKIRPESGERRKAGEWEKSGKTVPGILSRLSYV